jgi:hypothetical protein
MPFMRSVCLECERQNPWEELYCVHCGTCLKGAEVVALDPQTLTIERLRLGGIRLLILLLLVLSLTGVIALLGRLLL